MANRVYYRWATNIGQGRSGWAIEVLTDGKRPECFGIDANIYGRAHEFGLTKLLMARNPRHELIPQNKETWGPEPPSREVSAYIDENADDWV